VGRNFAFGMVMGAILLVASVTRSDVAPSDATATDTTDTAATLDPDPSAQSADATLPQKNPFEPYDVGGTEAIWPYESLTPDEQAVIDRTRDAAGWAQVHDGFGAAGVERSRKARAQAAEHQLGVDNLELSGVVQ
jgi:hypothetical protein